MGISSYAGIAIPPSSTQVSYLLKRDSARLFLERVLFGNLVFHCGGPIRRF
jgi:hypothetical protein